MKLTPLSFVWFCLLIVIGQDLCAQPEPHHLKNIAVASGNQVTLNFGGNSSNLFSLSAPVSLQFLQMFDLYPLDSSPDLEVWTRQAMLLRGNNDTGPLLYHETNASPSNARFYRTPANHFITAFPGPTGPFAVGTLVRMLTDPSRGNRYGIPTNSSFMSTFWYPADPPSAGDLPGAYADATVAGDANLYGYFGWDLSWTNLQVHCVTHSFPGLLPVAGTGRFPVILHSHGYAADRTLNSFLAAELASHGYIVAAVDHVDCHATVYPDARGAVYIPPGSISNLSGLALSRVNDFKYLLSQLPMLDASDPALAGRLDLGRIATMGWSFGGGTAANMGWVATNATCAALLDPFIDPAYNHTLATLGLQKPFLTMNNTVWAYTNITPSTDRFQTMSSNLFNLATANATWLLISNAHHQAFSDFAWSTDMTDGSRQAHRAIADCVLWFFDTYLKGQAPSFPTNTAIINVQRK